MARRDRGETMIQSSSAVLPPLAKTDIAYAGFWRRLLAYLIDGTLLAGVNLALYSTVHLLAPDNLDAVANVVPVAVAIGWAYFAVLESSRSEERRVGKECRS